VGGPGRVPTGPGGMAVEPQESEGVAGALGVGAIRARHWDPPRWDGPARRGQGL